MTQRKQPFIQTERTILRLPTESDIQAIIQYYLENSAHLAATDPPKPKDFYTLEFWQARVKKATEEFHLDHATRFMIFNSLKPTEIIGSASFSQNFRGPFQACYLGYSVAAKEEGKGYMTEALHAAIEYVFNELNFHRIMANYLTDNVRSGRLLNRLGFAVEGTAKAYLFINGEWRDHILTALTHPSWKNTF